MDSLRSFGRALATCVALTATPSLAAEYSLVIDQSTVAVDGKPRRAVTVNGTLPGPVLRFKEGEDVVVRVTNRLKEPSSVHWHGLLLPGDQDGAPGFNGWPGIRPGETYTYRFPAIQNGTYWYHAHSATQEQAGHYGAIIIDPAKPSTIQADREHVVLLSDFPKDDPERILRNLKVDPGYYNHRKRTVPDFFRDARRFGFGAALKDRLSWGSMRMDPTDIADVGGYAFLVNGKAPGANETLLFRPGERVRLRFINAAAMTFFDVRIPGLKMTVVAADGREVEPVSVDEFRLAVAETYDVIVEPEAEQAFTVFAESIDRTGYARATLAPREGMQAAIPPMRPRAVLLASEMGHALGPDGHSGMDHGAAGHGGHAPATAGDHAHHGGHAAPAAAAAKHDHAAHDGHAHAHAEHEQNSQNRATVATGTAAPASGSTPYPVVDYGMGKAADMGGHAMPALAPEGALDGSGRVFGWASGAPYGSKVLSYADLRSKERQKDTRPAQREIVVRLGGNMERYIWTLNGKTFEEAEPIRLTYGERVKLTFVNETMMAHPMHLHGMFVQLDNGQPAEKLPDKHVVSVAPGKTYSVLISADAIGEWAFHCHLLYHMESGMMSQVVVAKYDGQDPAPAAPTVDHSAHGSRS